MLNYITQGSLYFIKPFKSMLIVFCHKKGSIQMDRKIPMRWIVLPFYSMTMIMQFSMYGTLSDVYYWSLLKVTRLVFNSRNKHSFELHEVMKCVFGTESEIWTTGVWTLRNLNFKPVLTLSHVRKRCSCLSPFFSSLLQKVRVFLFTNWWNANF